MASKYQMQAFAPADGTLKAWLALTPDWAGSGFPGPGLPEATSIAIAGGGIGGSVSSGAPDGVFVLDDGSFVVFDDGSFVVGDVVGAVPDGAYVLDDGSYVVFDDGSYAISDDVNFVFDDGSFAALDDGSLLIAA